MSTSPKNTEEKLRRMINAWEQLAPTKKFAVTLDEFKAALKPSFDVRETIDDLEEQQTKALDDRENFDDASLDLAQRVVNAILADETEGKNSSLLEGFGRTRDSEKKTGLTRKKLASPPVQ